MSAARVPHLIAAGLSAVALAAPALTSPPARADVFGTITMLSASPFGQAEFAHDPALSEDGDYVVFDGSVAGVRGVWRRETRPGATLEEVAGGDATLPSVSADGEFVSFTTNEGSELAGITDELPDANESHEAPNVYVRDMGIPASTPCAASMPSNAPSHALRLRETS